MNIFNKVNKQLNRQFLLLFFFSAFAGFGQGASLSPHDLMESYFEKKTSYIPSSSKEISEINQKELDRITQVLADNAPNSYEYHLVKYANGNFDLSLKSHLFEAYKLKPDDSRVNKELFAYYTLTGDLAKQKEFANKIKGSYAANTLAYYRFLLAQKSKGYIVFSGAIDAYPALVVQALSPTKMGVKIINLDFLQNEFYRKQIQDGVGGMNMKFLGNEVAFIAALMRSPTAFVSVSSTVSQAYLRDVSSNTFLVGLMYGYRVLDQRSELESFWKKTQVTFSELTLTSRSDKALYSNFLPPLLTLYKLKCGSKEKDETLRSGIVTLSQKLDKEALISEILKGYEQVE